MPWSAKICRLACVATIHECRSCKPSGYCVARPTSSSCWKLARASELPLTGLSSISNSTSLMTVVDGVRLACWAVIFSSRDLISCRSLHRRLALLQLFDFLSYIRVRRLRRDNSTRAKGNARRNIAPNHRILNMCMDGQLLLPFRLICLFN